MATSKKLFFVFLFSFIFYGSLCSQNKNDEWIPVDVNDKLFINSSNILIDKDDIYVWVLENHSEPIKIEMIDKEIYKTKTYYLINKELKRYSILQIIFYDKNNNVIKSYSYNYNTDDINYKYSTPILEGSTVESVLLKSLGLFNNR
ncbi:MAG: surface-adhesin E family protein [Melioribacteraceae bacterium]